MKPPLLSIVSPVYKAEAILDELIKRLKAEISKLTENYEIILVEDGSPDQSWEKIEEVCHSNKQVKAVKLSRNFGQHYAISAGLAESRGDYVVVMDCDLQDNPKYIRNLLDKSKESFDIVYTVKNIREHHKLKNFISSCWSKIFNWLIGNKDLHSSGQIGAYSLITRKVVEAYNRIHDYYRPYLVVLQWLGFRTATIQIEHEKRFKGKSSYTLTKLLKHAANGIVSQTSKLLRLTIYIGFCFTIIGFISIFYIVVKSIEHGFQTGWASIAVLIIFSAGLILTSLGILGIYIGKIFEQIKGRPLYLIDKKLNF